MIGEALQRVPLFKDLLPDEIEKFVKFTGTTVKSYHRGERILEAFTPNANIGVIVSGEAQLLALDRLGNETVGHSLESGAMFGTISAILGEDLVATSVQLTTDAIIMWLPYRSLLIAGPKLGRMHGIVMKNLLESFSRKNVLMMQKVELLSQKTLRERMILYLLQRERRQESEQVRVPGRVQLAKELECNRSALTREISQMQAEGIVECGDKWMRLNKEMLQ
ncbi:MAG: Crp/Fnr family transcriptional regulator [Selenomonadaceae bacterium]|nr:Crp/Fnr family transcriptional regulator [Selenomonadaceae bacterium]